AKFDYAVPSLSKWYEIAAFSPQKGRFIALFTDTTERKQAEDLLLWGRRRDELLADVAGRLLSSEEPQAVANDLCRETMAFLACDVFFNYLVDAHRECLHLNAFAGIPEAEAKKIEWLDYGVAVCGCAARDGCRIIAEEIPTTPDPRTELVGSYGVQAYACHPLVVEGRVLGTLSFGTRSRTRFSERDLAVMKSVADSIAIAMHRLVSARTLRESEEKYRTLVEQSLQALVMLRDGRIVFANERAAEFGGYTVQELRALSPDQVVGLYHPDDRPVIVKRMKGRLAGELEPTRYEARLVRKDCSMAWAELFVSVVQYEGRPTHQVSFIDITERKEAEITLQRYAADLQDYADNLKRSNEDLERFAYVSSHDLQEPLRTIVTFTQLLERRYKGEMGAEADEFIHYIVSGGKRMQSLINDLLEFSRVTSKGRSFGTVNLETVLRQDEGNLQQSIAENQAIILHDPLPTVIADESQMTLVFQNLIGNALKFRREDPVRIHVGAKRIDHGWQFSVQDNGIGIAPEYFDRIFVIFQRLHSMDTYDGTGIGLAIVKRIIDRHGGRIWVESEVGKGSTSFFTLPGLPVGTLRYTSMCKHCDDIQNDIFRSIAIT
ncbi:MAG: PAS domain S-box protein, partial [Methanobacteriota archaeon]